MGLVVCSIDDGRGAEAYGGTDVVVAGIVTGEERGVSHGEGGWGWGGTYIETTRPGRRL